MEGARAPPAGGGGRETPDSEGTQGRGCVGDEIREGTREEEGGGGTRGRGGGLVGGLAGRAGSLDDGERRPLVGLGLV